MRMGMCVCACVRVCGGAHLHCAMTLRGLLLAQDKRRRGNRLCICRYVDQVHVRGLATKKEKTKTPRPAPIQAARPPK